MDKKFETIPNSEVSPAGGETFEVLVKNIQAELLEKFGGEDGREVLGDKHLNQLYQAIPNLIDRARDAANNHGMSYRGFKVGCACLAYNSALEGTGQAPYQVFTGSNQKPNSLGPKVCAEQVAVNSVFLKQLEGGDQKVIGLLVAGNPQEDSASGLNPPTLHPCEDCRELVTARLENSGNDPAKVVLITVGLNNDDFEVFNWEEMRKLHEGNQQED